MPTPLPLARSISSRVEKPGRADQIEDRGFVEFPVGQRQTKRAGARGHRLQIHPATVVGNLEQHGVADADSAQGQRAFGGLAGCQPLGRGFEAVGDGVPHQMEDGIHHALDEVLVDLRLLPAQVEPHLRLDLALEIADHESHPLENLAHGNEPHAGHAVPQILQLPFNQYRVFLDGSPLPSRHMALGGSKRVVEPGPADHQIADHAHQLVEAGQLDPNDVPWRDGNSLGTVRPGSVERPSADR